MTINAPKRSQIPAMRRLWQEAFGDTEEFLDIFGKTAFDVNRSRIVVADGNVAAALYWFDCLHMERRIAYVYAIATAEAYRGRGICHALMENTQRHLMKLGYEGAVLVPGSEGLFRFYESMGYLTCSTIKEFSCPAGAEEVPLRPIDIEEYAKFRRRLLPEGGVVQENENLVFLRAQAQLYAGSGFLLTVRQENDKLFGVELLGDETKAAGILKALACAQGTFRVPGEGKPFAMYHSFTGNALPAPTYFGLAFD